VPTLYPPPLAPVHASSQQINGIVGKGGSTGGGVGAGGGVGTGVGGGGGTGSQLPDTKL
jgi:hypothetical protein